MSTEARSAAESSAEMAELSIHKGPEASLECGGLRFEACRREIEGIDGGVTLYVWSTNREPPVALLRFDLFRKSPHYHAPAEDQADTAIEAPSGGAIEWGLDALSTRAADFVREAGEDAIANVLDQAELAAGREELAALIDGLEEPNETSTLSVPRAVLDGLAAS